MEPVYLAISNAPVRMALVAALREVIAAPVIPVLRLTEIPANSHGIVVVDDVYLEQVEGCIEPEHVILVAAGNDRIRRRAWEIGVEAVIDEKNSMSTVGLVVLGAQRRLPLSPVRG